MPAQQQRWIHNLIRATQNKRSSRVGTPLQTRNGFEVAYELTGVDGRYEGGAKVFPGFESVIPIDPTATWGSTPAAPTSDYTIDSFRAVKSFRIGENSYGYGIVYRVASGNDSSGNDEHLFIKYRVGTSATWYERHLDWYIPSGTRWDVQVYGSLVYIFVEGRNPILFYATDTTPTEVQIGGANATSSGTRTGPGPRPRLIGPSHDEAVSIGALNDPASGDAHGQVHVPANGGGTAAQPPATQTDAAGTNLLFDDGMGTYDGPQTNADTSQLDPGDYLVCFQLRDSVTGRRSPLSDIVELKTSDFPNSGTSVARIALEIVYDDTKWDTALLYRSVAGDDAGGTYGSAFKHLDNVITLADYQTTQQNAYSAGYGAALTGSRAVYYFEADDKVLASQEAWVEAETFDEEMPPGGAALMHEGSMLISLIENSADDTDDIDDLGETRYSAISYVSPELFPPANRFVPNVVDDAVERFVAVNDNVIGFTPNRLRFFRRDGASMATPRDLHNGFGITGSRAVEVVGGSAYYLSQQGIKTVNATAALDSLQSADHIITYDWKGSLDSVSMAYDAMLQALFILNPTNSEALVLWFNKTKVTSLVDMDFAGCERGTFPEDTSDAATNLRERAMFLHAYGTGSGGQYSVMVVDEDKADGGTRTMLPYTGSHILTVDQFPQLNRIQLDGSYTLNADMAGKRVYLLKSSAEIAGSTTITAVGGNYIDVASRDDLGSSIVKGDKLGIAPVVFRWISPPLYNEDRVGRRIPDVGITPRQVQTVKPVFSRVSGDAEGQVWSTYQSFIYRRDEASVFGRGKPEDSKGNQVEGIREGPALYSGAIHAVTSSAGEAIGLRGKYAPPATSLCVGIEVVCPDIDFVMIACRTEGTITDERTEGRVGLT